MLTKKQFKLLVFLTEQKQGISQREVANKLNISLGTVNKLFKELSSLGYVSNGAITQEGIDLLENNYRVKHAILMAAGFGSRMVPITFNTPKPLVRVHGTRIIDTIIDGLIAAEVEEIYVVRGYLGEQFDQLLYKYPNVKFINNPIYNTANNIGSILQVGDLVRSSYVIEADIYVSNPKIFTKYQYSSNYLAIPVKRTDDYCLYVEDGVIKSTGLGGVDCYQQVGISYWTDNDGKKIAGYIQDVFNSPGGKERFWGSIPLSTHKHEFVVGIRECAMEDVKEIDSFQELKEIDPSYNV